MKRLLLVSLAIFFAFSALAQTTPREEIDAHPHLANITLSTYGGPYYFEPIAKAPKGYKPFYISHYGRHGSRHEANIKYPAGALQIFLVADSLNLLTAKGKEVKAVMHKIYEAHDGRIGELTPIGYEQHKGIARRMYRRFKPVFYKGARVDSRSSSYTRCILSMAGFNEGLKECEPLLDVRVDAAEEHQDIIRPRLTFTKDPRYFAGYENSDEDWWLKLVDWTSKQDLSHCAKVMFTDIDLLSKHLGRSPMAIVIDVFKRLGSMQNLGWHDRTLIDEIYTPDERYTIFLYENYRWYCRYVSTKVDNGVARFVPMQNTVKDIIKYADLAIEGKNSAVANFRFGHDYYLLGLFSIMGINECSGDADISSVEKLGELWPAFRKVTMASNLQFVFYRSKKSPDVLVRLLENENDVTLPIESPIAPFYKWNDVKSYLLGRVKMFNEAAAK